MVKLWKHRLLNVAVWAMYFLAAFVTSYADFPRWLIVFSIFCWGSAATSYTWALRLRRQHRLKNARIYLDGLIQRDVQ